jgi:hypothetical protein
LVCEYCGAGFQGLSHSRFCSGKCKAAWRRAQGVDDEMRACVVCKTEFRVNRFSRSRSCSPDCRGKLGGAARTGHKRNMRRTI